MNGDDVAVVVGVATGFIATLLRMILWLLLLLSLSINLIIHK